MRRVQAQCAWLISARKKWAFSTRLRISRYTAGAFAVLPILGKKQPRQVGQNLPKGIVAPLCGTRASSFPNLRTKYQWAAVDVRTRSRRRQTSPLLHCADPGGPDVRRDPEREPASAPTLPNLGRRQRRAMMAGIQDATAPAKGSHRVQRIWSITTTALPHRRRRIISIAL